MDSAISTVGFVLAVLCACFLLYEFARAAWHERNRQAWIQRATDEACYQWRLWLHVCPHLATITSMMVSPTLPDKLCVCCRTGAYAAFYRELARLRKESYCEEPA